MTVVVWDGKTLAADRQANTGNLRRTTKKIRRHKDTLVAIVGSYTAGEAIINWLACGADPGKFPEVPSDNSVVWVIHKNGEALRFEGSPFPVKYTDSTFADGSGADFAYGAMAMGADACQAVSVAIKYDLYCGGGVDALSFED